MKKLFLIFTVTIIFAMFFAGCQKQELQIQESNISAPNTTLQKILNFKNKIENEQNSKSNETLSIDSAVWYIEATLNYTYCIINKDTNFNDFIFLEDSINENIDINEQILTFQDIYMYYTYFEKIFKNIEKEKSIICADIYIKNNKFHYNLLLSNLTEKTVPSPDFNGFSNEAYYFDADDMINKEVNKYIRINTPAGFYTDIETIEWLYPPQEYLRNNSSNDQYHMYYYIFYRPTSENNLDIISAEELNFYYYGAFTAATLVQQHEGINMAKRLISIDFKDDAMACTDCAILHWGFFTYGNFVPTSIPDNQN